MTEQTLLTMEDLKGLSAEDLLNVDFSSMEEVAGFLQPPKGLYVFDVPTIGFVNVAKEGAPANMAVQVEFVIRETVQLANETDTPCKAGDKFTMTWRGGQGVAYLRSDFQEVITTLGTKDLAGFMAALPGATITGEVSYRLDKDDKDKKYIQLRHLRMV